MMRFQYSLRSMLIGMTAMAVPLGWIACVRKEVAEREREMAVVKRTNECNVYYVHEVNGSSPPGPAWLRKLVGDNAFAEPEVECWSIGELRVLRSCPRLTRLRLSSFSVSNTSVEELALFSDLPHLTYLDLRGVKIDNDAFRFVGELRNLQTLDLRCNSVGDAGLKHLAGLSSLRVLLIDEDLADGTVASQVTDESMKYIGRLTNLEELRLNCHLISDSGVKELHNLSKLRTLNLATAQITDSSLAEIGRLRHLERLNVTDTQITPSGINEFQRRCPGVLAVSGTSGFIDSNEW